MPWAGTTKWSSTRISTRPSASFSVRVSISSAALGSLAPEDVLVELVLGHAKGPTDLHNMMLVRLQPVSQSRSRPQSPWIFEGGQRVTRSGTYSYGVRVRSREEASAGARSQELVLWA